MNSSQLLRASRARQGCVAVLLVATPLAISGCVSVPKDLGTAEVSASAQARSTVAIAAPPSSEDTNQQIAALLDKPLTQESAVQIALLRNPEVRATFAQLGLSRADLVEAGTLPNPSLSGMARFGVGPATGTMAELDSGFPLLDAIMLPLRKKVETENFEQAKLEAADRLLALVMDVRHAWFEAIAAQQEAALAASAQEAADAAAELARRQYDAGNISRLDRLSYESLAVRTRLEARELEGAAAAKEQVLRQALGLTPSDPDWMLMPRWPEIPGVAPDPTSLDAIAAANRLDLAAAQHRVQSAEHGLRLAKRFRFVPMLDVGVSADREAEGDWFVGPSLDLELPIFDRKRANVMRFEAMTALAKAEGDAAKVRAYAEVRTAAAALASAADRVTAYEKELLPLQRDLVDEMQLHYNGMLVGVYDLLTAKQNALEIERGAVRARLDFWLARADLERAIAGPVPVTAAEPAATETPAPAPGTNAAEPHHHEEN